MLTDYADKENAPIGHPVVKGSDIERVRRNLSIPLQTRNVLENNNNAKTSFSLSGRQCVNSPVTELAYDFTELAAHETSCNNTPKRRLSLASSAGSPTPDFCRIQTAFSGSSKSNVSLEVSSSSSSDSGSATKSTKDTNFNGSGTRGKFGSGAFKRYNSMPFGSAFRSENSPVLSQPIAKGPTTVSPLALPQATQPSSSTTFYLGSDEASRDSQDSGIDKDEDRFSYLQEENRNAEFLAPAVPPERTQAINEHSPIVSGKRVVGSPDLFESTAQDSSESPLLSNQLCSHLEEDDGFIDLDYLEKQGAKNDVPASIANMLTGKMITNSKPLPPAPSKLPQSLSFRGSLFRSPSMPQQLSTTGNSYDIRRRVLCGNKRPDPPNDSTPTAIVKKRRGLISEGNLKPVQKERGDPSITNRLQRCRSMVEQSVSFHRSKSESDGLTGDGKKCCLPLINGKNSDLNNISHETMSQLLNNEFSETVSDYTVIDCRYPYEYNGGHIKGAENIYTKEDIYSRYLKTKPKARDDDKRSILIFHCEFSSERAPKLSRFLRNWDRDINDECYPNLFHPELYLLEGGYKVFFESHKDLCEPQTYTPMLHKKFTEDLKTFRAKSKSWAGDEKRGGFRTGMLCKRL